jgi:hypothetical protein
MRKKSSFAFALGAAILMSGQAIATASDLVPQKPAATNDSPVRLAANSLAAAGGVSKKKICTNTYHAGGIRCTFCYCTTQPGSGSTVCIKLNTNNSSSSGKSASSIKAR